MITRQLNILGQARIDAHALRQIESAGAYDFDVLGQILVGELPTIVNGFEVLTTGAVGNAASSLIMVTADSCLIHYLASEAGSVFKVQADREPEVLTSVNPRVVGSFTPSSTNFVGLDLIRSVDDSTADIVQFLNPDTNLETPRTVPMARVMDYRIVISTTEFSAAPGVAPVVRVVTDAQNKVTAITDCRHLMFRLGSGGSNPLAINPYGWPGGRNENSLVSIAGDKSIQSFKDWMAAQMTRTWEIGGGEYWYSATADRNVRMTSSVVFTSTGQPFEWDGTNIHWKGLQFTFDNSTAGINEVEDQLTDVVGLTDLEDGECIYVDLDRTIDRTVAGLNPIIAQKGVLKTLGMSTTPGARWVCAWRVGANIYLRDQSSSLGGGAGFDSATTAAQGIIRTSIDPLVSWDSANPVAVGLAYDITGLYTATAGGLSHNLDLGTTTLVAAGDLVIGRGSAAGDQNILLTTNATQYNTLITGSNLYSSHQKAALKVLQNGFSDDYDARIVEFAADIFGTQEVKVHIESDGAIGIANMSRIPSTPAPTVASPARLKAFTRKSKYFKADGRLATNAVLPTYIAAGVGIGKTLTATANGALSVDGTAVALNDRVLVKNEVGANARHNGIYTVTQTGSGGSPYILTRALLARTNTEVFTGIAITITAGSVNTGSSWMLNSPAPFDIDTTANGSQFWIATDTSLRDQVCVMWHDGSYTVICEGPTY